MSDIPAAFPQIIPETEDGYKQAFFEIMAEVEKLNEQMRLERIQIERLRAESAILRDETRTILSGIEARL